MRRLKDQIERIEEAVCYGGQLGNALHMANGEVWFHPYNGSQPWRVA